MHAVIEFHDVTKEYGDQRVLGPVSGRIEAGGITALIGPNGAGKSSLVNCVTGFYRPQEGKISLFGRETTGLPAHRSR